MYKCLLDNVAAQECSKPSCLGLKHPLGLLFTPRQPRLLRLLIIHGRINPRVSTYVSLWEQSSEVVKENREANVGQRTQASRQMMTRNERWGQKEVETEKPQGEGSRWGAEEDKRLQWGKKRKTGWNYAGASVLLLFLFSFEWLISHRRLLNANMFFLSSPLLQMSMWPVYISPRLTHISQSWRTSRPSTWAWTRTGPSSQTTIGNNTLHYRVYYFWAPGSKFKSFVELSKSFHIFKPTFKLLIKVKNNSKLLRIHWVNRCITLEKDDSELLMSLEITFILRCLFGNFPNEKKKRKELFFSCELFLWRKFTRKEEKTWKQVNTSWSKELNLCLIIKT